MCSFAGTLSERHNGGPLFMHVLIGKKLRGQINLDPFSVSLG